MNTVVGAAHDPNGVFRAARTDDPHIIAIEVDNARGPKIFANEDSIRKFIARQFKTGGAPSDSRRTAGRGG